MRLETTRFGAIEIDPESVYTFTQPIIGFETYRRFVLVPGPEGSRLGWLQSIEEGALAFLLIQPEDVYPGYEVALGQAELSELAVKEPSELRVYTLLVVPDDPAKVRTNLKAPILLNPRQRLGKQTVLERSNYPIQFFLAQARREAEPSAEVGHARADA